MTEQNKKETHDLYAVRLNKLLTMREEGCAPFHENCEQPHSSDEARAVYSEDENNSPIVKVAGRMTVFRLMGKAAFVKILDRDGLIQLYFKRDEVGEDYYKAFKKLDLGDIIGAEGPLFKTKTGK